MSPDDESERSETDSDDDPLALLRAEPPTPAVDLDLVVAFVRGRPALVVAALLLALGAGVAFVVMGRGSAPTELSLPTLTTVTTPAPPPTTAGTATTSTGPVLAHAAGAVARPGVYELAPGSRVADLVAAAGGLTAEADADRVNLADRVVDGQRVYVPRLGESEVPEVVGGAGGASGSPEPTGDPGGAAQESPLVDINTASLEELDTLPGVGPTTAQAIVDHREANGPFATVDDLLDVRGIGDAKLEQLRPLVSV